MDQKTIDYASFLALFKDGMLILQNMTVPAGVCTILGEVVDDALSHELAALPDEQAVEILNRNEILTHQVPHVQIIAGGEGILSLPAYQLKLVSFTEVVNRLQLAIETFELYLFDKDLPNRHAYRWNLIAWQHLDADTILDYRSWLLRYIPQEEHHIKLAALLLYSRLANKSAYLTEDQLDEIVAAVDQPLQPQGSRGTRTRQSTRIVKRR